MTVCGGSGSGDSPFFWDNHMTVIIVTVTNHCCGQYAGCLFSGTCTFRFRCPKVAVFSVPIVVVDWNDRTFRQSSSITPGRPIKSIKFIKSVPPTRPIKLASTKSIKFSESNRSLKLVAFVSRFQTLSRRPRNYCFKKAFAYRTTAQRSSVRESF